MEDFKIKEYESLFMVYLATMRLMANKDIINHYHMTMDIGTQAEFKHLITYIEEYTTNNSETLLENEHWKTIKASYDFLKNKNIVSLEESK
jgi:hypothetical protein